MSVLVLLVASGWGVGTFASPAGGEAAWDVVGRALSVPVAVEAAGQTEKGAASEAEAVGVDPAAERTDAPADDEPDGLKGEGEAEGTAGTAGGGDAEGDRGVDACTPGQIDVNRARSFDLQVLPGIGPVKADRIVAFRREHGPFQHPEDLLDVKGIGPATLAKLLPEVCAGGELQAGA